MISIHSRCINHQKLKYWKIANPSSHFYVFCPALNKTADLRADLSVPSYTGLTSLAKNTFL